MSRQPSSSNQPPLPFRLFQGFLRLIPRPVHLALFRLLARLAYRLDRRHTHIARVNLDLAFGDTLPEAEKRLIILRTYESYFGILGRG